MILTLDNQINGNIHTIEVGAELSFGDLLIVIAAETEVEIETITILHNGKYLDTSKAAENSEKTLASLSFCENDMLILQAKPLNKPTPKPHSDFIADMEKKFLLSRMKQANPKMADVFEKNPEEYDRLMEEEVKRRRIMSDPNSLEVQQAIEEAIRQENVLRNMEAALEENPESFGHIDMLYVRCQVDGHSIDAFVDTGAQMTIMTLECAEKCGILRLLDKRYEGVAVGVGTGKICGRIHAVPIKLGTQHIPCAFTVLESNSGPEVIVGLDTLRRLHATIDMKLDALIVNEEIIPFLKGNEIPKESFGSMK